MTRWNTMNIIFKKRRWVKLYLRLLGWKQVITWRGIWMLRLGTTKATFLLEIWGLYFRPESISSTWHRKIWSPWSRPLICELVFKRMVTKTSRAVYKTRSFRMKTFYRSRLAGKSQGYLSVTPLFVLIVVRRALGVRMIRVGPSSHIFRTCMALSVCITGRGK